MAGVEFQFPFSEPIADGPLFLTASQAILGNGTVPGDCFDLLERASEKFSFETVMMGSYNTAYTHGRKKSCEDLTSSIVLEKGAGFIYKESKQIYE